MKTSEEIQISHRITHTYKEYPFINTAPNPIPLNQHLKLIGPPSEQPNVAQLANGAGSFALASFQLGRRIVGIKGSKLSISIIVLPAADTETRPIIRRALA